ncbi:MAG: hypothetical protein HY748_07440 [Elusimicrobia bacterium]|nr:hypothetical protein [Elusimicrobiota bacterium]
MAPQTSFVSPDSTSAPESSLIAASNLLDPFSAAPLQKLNWHDWGTLDNSATCGSVDTTDLSSTVSTAASSVLTMRHRAETDLNRYQQFAFGWDGYFGETFGPILIQSAKQLICAVSDYFIGIDTVPQEILPGPASDGSVDIEISCRGRRIIFTLYPNSDKVNIYKERDEKPVEEYLVPGEDLNLEAELSWLAV